MNSVQLIGRLTRNPELRRTESGKSVARFTIAVDRNTKEKQTDFIDCIAWEAQAENLERTQKKGNRIGVEGRIQVRSYEKDGENRKMTEVVAARIEYLTPRSEQEPAFSASEEDIPF